MRKKKLLTGLLTLALTVTAFTGMPADNVYAGEQQEGVTTETVIDETGDNSVYADINYDSLEVAAGETLALNETNFPDATFRQYLSSKFDTDKNGYIDPSKVTEIDVSSNGLNIYYIYSDLYSLQGIENFTNLEELHCATAKISSLDLSKNPNLKDLFCVACDNLSYINLSKNTQLIRLDCHGNNLTSLDVSNSPNLETLYCYSNNITSLDVTNNPKLTELSCGENKITSLDVSKNPELRYLSCEENNITSLDISNNKKLADLTWDVTLITTLDRTAFENGLTVSWVRDDRPSGLPDALVYILEMCLKDGNWVVTCTAYEFDSAYINPLKNEYFTDGVYHYYFQADGTALTNGSVQLPDGRTAYFDEYGREITGGTTDVALSTQGIYVAEASPNGILAGMVTTASNPAEIEYSWYASKNGGSWILAQDWTKGNEWLSWTPQEYGDYVLVCKARVGKDDSTIVQSTAFVAYNPHIKGKCQMPYTGEGGGYLIGMETYDNQSYQYEMLILDCTLLAEGKDAWIYTTGKCGVAEGNAFWTIWQPQYGYYWTLFRVYDSNGVLIDEMCYGFENIC